MHGGLQLAATHCPPLHVSSLPHTPHAPPQPSLPHAFPVQSLAHGDAGGGGDCPGADTGGAGGFTDWPPFFLVFLRFFFFLPFTVPSMTPIMGRPESSPVATMLVRRRRDQPRSCKVRVNSSNRVASMDPPTFDVTTFLHPARTDANVK